MNENYNSIRNVAKYVAGAGAVLTPIAAGAQDAEPMALEEVVSQHKELFNITPKEGETIYNVPSDELAWNVAEDLAAEHYPGFGDLTREDQDRVVVDVNNALMTYQTERAAEEAALFPEGSEGRAFYEGVSEASGPNSDTMSIVHVSQMTPAVRARVNEYQRAAQTFIRRRDLFESDSTEWIAADAQVKIYESLVTGITAANSGTVPTVVARADGVYGDLWGGVETYKPVLVPGEGFWNSLAGLEDVLEMPVGEGEDTVSVRMPVTGGDTTADFERQKFALTGGYEHFEEHGALPIVGNGVVLEGGLRIPTSDKGSIYMDANRISLSHLNLGGSGVVTVLDFDLSAAYGWNVSGALTLTAGGRLQARANNGEYAGKEFETGRAIPAFELGLRGENEKGMARVAVNAGIGGGSDAQEVIGFGISADATAHAGPVDITAFGGADHYRSTAELEDGAELNTSSSTANVGGAVDVFPTRARNWSVGVGADATVFDGPAAEEVTPSGRVFLRTGFKF